VSAAAEAGFVGLAEAELRSGVGRVRPVAARQVRPGADGRPDRQANWHVCSRRNSGDTVIHASAIRRLLVILALAALLTGCERTSRWQEEVQLSDGAVLRVDRAVSYRAPSGALGQPIGRQALGERLSFADPGTGRVVEWHESRRRSVWLDRIDTQFWLVAILSTPCESGYGHMPVWKAYSLRDEQWHAVDPANVPVAPVRNLLTTDYSIIKHLRFVSLSVKQRLNATYSKGAIDLLQKNGCSGT
jgi:hypothetical protein